MGTVYKIHKMYWVHSCEMPIDVLGPVCYYNDRKEVNDMSKRKKSGKADRLATYINLTTALLNLIVALLLLIETLSG